MSLCVCMWGGGGSSNNIVGGSDVMVEVKELVTS